MFALRAVTRCLGILIGWRLVKPLLFSSTKARVQFRLPDGRGQTQVFDADTPLSTLYTHVREQMNVPFKKFTLSTTFPTKVSKKTTRLIYKFFLHFFYFSQCLDNENQSSQLREHGLVPSGTVLILPKEDRSLVGAGTDGGIMALVWLVLTPVTVLFNLVMSFFGGGGAADASGSTQRG